MQPSPVPPLDSELAKPCKVPAAPDVLDFDVWQEWSFDLLQELAECGARHRETVASWPK